MTDILDAITGILVENYFDEFRRYLMIYENFGEFHHCKNLKFEESQMQLKMMRLGLI